MKTPICKTQVAISLLALSSLPLFLSSCAAGLIGLATASQTAGSSAQIAGNVASIKNAFNQITGEQPATNTSAPQPQQQNTENVNNAPNGLLSSQQGLLNSAIATTGMPPAQPALVNALTNKLGITQQQALGGAGAIFTIAQQQMSPSTFSQLTQVVPGMSQMLSVGAPLLSNISNAPGAPTGIATLNDPFQQLGLSGNAVQQFIPVILQYVQSQAGAAVAGYLRSALI